MTPQLKFAGAARQVTGSKHLLTTATRSILLDCGMVQGPRRLANRLNREFPPELLDVDAVVLSHAHVDHSGSLPRLVRLGYRGPIYCTPATRDLLSILLPDSAHIQSSDARYLRKQGHSFEPAYDAQDVERTLGLIECVEYREEYSLFPEVKLRFLDAGHILGSAQVVLDVYDEDPNQAFRLAFTGDCGRKHLPILRDPDPLPPCDVLITESTYGDRRHPSREEQLAELRDVLRQQAARGGRVLIPAFSVGRTQNILWHLSQLIHSGEIDPLPIYVDSPLSTKATAIVAAHRDLYDAETRAMLDAGHNPFFFPGVHSIADVEESMELNELRHGIIISASGMCEGGRVLHHLKVTVGNPEDTVLIVGFQAQGTLGRKLLEGYEYVKIFGMRHRVNCRVHHVDGLSAHADSQELVEHLEPLAPHTGQVFVVHGEESAAMRLADRLLDAGFPNVEVPLHNESFEIRPGNGPRNDPSG